MVQGCVSPTDRAGLLCGCWCGQGEGAVGVLLVLPQLLLRVEPGVTYDTLDLRVMRGEGP